MADFGDEAGKDVLDNITRMARMPFDEMVRIMLRKMLNGSKNFEPQYNKEGKRNMEALIQACGKMQGWKDWATVGGNETIEDAVRDGNFERDPELAIDGIKEKPDLDSGKEPKEYGIDQLMADLSDETPETGEDGPGGRD
ncbi:hypothetical protein [Dorea longicatena]|uniref:hypothetical protein n=1 Tax=Dorea longicatena TaxID=88431 RepID=UPI0032C0BD04